MYIKQKTRGFAPTSTGRCNMKTPTLHEMVTRYEIWAEYVDPAAIIKEKQFKKMSVEEKVRIIESVFGPEKPKEDAAE